MELQRALPFIGVGVTLAAGLAGFLFIRYRRVERRIGSNATFIVTGAGSGIGRISSRILCQDHGVKLVLVDKNKEAIDSLSKELGTKNAIPFYCDLSTPEDIEKLSKWVQETHNDVSGLLHFAGLTHGKPFLEASVPEIDLILAVNFLAVIKLSRLLLPTLLRNRQPTLLVVSSVAGLIGTDGMVDYCATKYGVSGFCESLRKELKHTNPELSVCCVYPYFINTGMFAGIKGSLIPELDQKQVAARIVQAICNREEYVVIPSFFGILATLTRILPGQVTELVERAIGAQHMMRGYTGRQK